MTLCLQKTILGVFTMSAKLYSFTCPLLAAVVSSVTAMMLVPAPAYGDWKVDLSHRQQTMRQAEMQQDTEAQPSRFPASQTDTHSFDRPARTTVDTTIESVPAPASTSTWFDSGEPIQEVVVLNTDTGFMPSTLRLRKGSHYKIHVVNINEKEKNVSFVLDAFSEHHATYYGKIKTFEVEPKKEGTYSFQCPETSSEGRVVVFAPAGAQNLRVPASEDGK
jgi:plastocyanin